MTDNEWDIMLTSKSLCSKVFALLASLSEILKLKLCICIIFMFVLLTQILFMKLSRHINLV